MVVSAYQATAPSPQSDDSSSLSPSLPSVAALQIAAVYNAGSISTSAITVSDAALLALARVLGAIAAARSQKHLGGGGHGP
jgi:hypothetical protein